MTENSKPLKDRVAIVTGASRGIGAAVSVRLAELGAHLILVARTKAGLEEIDDKIRSIGGTATLTPLDLSQGVKIDQFPREIMEALKLSWRAVVQNTSKKHTEFSLIWQSFSNFRRDFSIWRELNQY